jgi:GNAT superfamily N-acetyltransferase
MDWRRDIFERYARESVAQELPGYQLERLSDLTRHIPVDGGGDALFSFARFAPRATDDRIDSELLHARSHGWELEWKVHDFDEPADLKARLEARGLKAHHEEALMVLEVATAHGGGALPAGVAIEEARGDTLDALADFQEEIWQCRLPWLADALHAMADPAQGDTALVYAARAHGRIVGSGWIEFPPRSSFAQLHGGAVREDWRGRGVYSALFERRLADARQRGFPWIAVDAAPMSRPILERKGFRFVCHTYPMRTRPFDTGPVTRG